MSPFLQSWDMLYYSSLFTRLYKMYFFYILCSYSLDKTLNECSTDKTLSLLWLYDDIAPVITKT